MHQTRRAIVQAQGNARMSSFLIAEIAIAALLVGTVTESSNFGLAVFFGLFVSIYIPYLGLIVLGLFMLIWTLFFFSFGWQVGGLAGCLILGIFGTLFMAGFHVAGLAGMFDAAS
ncbi:MAG: hypothetical protein HKN42_06965 [Granulosicoccus sp.]|nr:hypothetical protein [Granulosicoccus sp.]